MRFQAKKSKKPLSVYILNIPFVLAKAGVIIVEALAIYIYISIKKERR